VHAQLYATLAFASSLHVQRYIFIFKVDGSARIYMRTFVER